MTTTNQASNIERLLLTPEEAARALGIGRTKLYRLLATNQLRSVRIDGSRRVTAAALGDFVRELDVRGRVESIQDPEIANGIGTCDRGE